MDKIVNQKLLKKQAYIEGKWVDRGIFFPVLNPFSGSEICKVADTSSEDAIDAIEAADRAFRSWGRLAPQQRSPMLLEVALLLEKNMGDFSRIITLEQGKPLAEAKAEISLSLTLIKWVVEEGARIHGITLDKLDDFRFGSTLRQPVGVVAAISPWNFPLFIPVQKVFSALAAGCTVVLKPAEDTPLSALALAALCEEAGIPPGVFNVLPCKNPESVGGVLTKHPLVRKIAFTGSTEVGKKILEMSASTVKKVTLELGGNCPLIVFEDADIEHAVNEALRLKFYNAGQCCNSINRILLQKGIADRFVHIFSEKAKALSVGSGLAGCSMGPLINKDAKEKVQSLVSDAIRGGAKTSMAPKKEEGLLSSPVVLHGCSQRMALWHEEIFGPVAACYTFDTEKEAISMANDTRYGLAAYVFTENLDRAVRLSLEIEAGTIGINGTHATSMTLPYGGWKESGIGRVRGIQEALNDYCETKSVSLTMKTVAID